MTTDRRKSLILEIIEQDRTFEFSKTHGYWIGKCIHCNSHITISSTGKTMSATIEHIIPQTHGGTDDVSNLAFACSSCNNTKGRQIDKLSKRDPRYLQVIEILLKKKNERIPRTPRKI